MKIFQLQKFPELQYVPNCHEKFAFAHTIIHTNTRIVECLYCLTLLCNAFFVQILTLHETYIQSFNLHA